jgi:hypothetical protein
MELEKKIVAAEPIIIENETDDFIDEVMRWKSQNL